MFKQVEPSTPSSSLVKQEQQDNDGDTSPTPLGNPPGDPSRATAPPRGGRESMQQTNSTGNDNDNDTNNSLGGTIGGEEPVTETDELKLLRIIKDVVKKYPSEIELTSSKTNNNNNNNNNNPLRHSGSGKKREQPSNVIIKFSSSSNIADTNDPKIISLPLSKLAKSFGKGQSGSLSNDVDQFIKLFHQDLFNERHHFRSAVSDRVERYNSKQKKAGEEEEEEMKIQTGSGYTLLFNNLKWYTL